MASDPKAAKQLFQELCELDLSEREARLSECETEDPELVARVRGLFSALDDLDTMFDQSVAAATRPAFEDLQIGSTVGPFEIVDVIGEGGFAVVFRARQSKPVVRDVALKVLKPGMDSSQVVARFEAERQALALMEHPSIATVFDGGVTEGGRFWFAMELVHGQDLTTWCESRSLPFAERLELFVRVCHAVQHAHQKGIVHRDLKPSNILVTEVDGRAIPVVIDFGVAKAVEQPQCEDLLVTRVGQLVGTPAYMAPEQFRGGADIDTRSDVYALGTILYELLADSRPFEDSTLQGLSLAEAMRVVQEVEPPRPSLRLRGRGSVPRGLMNDLDWVVMRCLEKDRERRYESVAVLANEVERALRNEPVLAGPPDWSYRASKFLRRNRLEIAAALLIVGLLSSGLVLVSAQLHRARKAEADLIAENRQKEIALSRERESNRFWESIWARIEPERASAEDTAMLQGLLQDAEAEVERHPLEQPEVEATIRRILGNAYFAIGHHEPAERHLRRAVDLRRELLPPDDPDRLESEHEYGTLLATEGKHADALPILEDTAARRERVLGPDDPATLRTIEALGSTLRSLGRTDEAREVLTRLVDRVERREDRVTSRSIRAINNLALLYSDLGDNDAALRMLAVAALQQESLHGEDHPDTHRAWNNLGEELCAVGRTDEGIPYLRRALHGKLARLSEGHPSAMIGFNNLASYLKNIEQLDESRRLFEEGLAAAERAGTTTTEAACVLRFNYASLLHQCEFEIDAEREFRRAADDALATLGENSSTTIRLRSELGWQLHRMQRDDEAEPLLAWGARQTARLPEQDPGRVVLPIRHGIVLQALGRSVEAKPILERGVEEARERGLTTWVDAAEEALGRMDG